MTTSTEREYEIGLLHDTCPLARDARLRIVDSPIGLCTWLVKISTSRPATT